MATNPSARRYLLVFAGLSLALLCGVALLNWRVDPLQYYRRAAYPPEFSIQSRYQDPGLARNYRYDTVILGTSVSFGFDLRALAARTGWHPINLSMAGSSAHEQRLLLDLALSTGQVRHVLWDLNYEFFRGRPDWVSDYDGSFPAYLYDSNPLDKITNYLLNIDVTKASFHTLFRLLLHQPSPVTMESLTTPPPRETGAAALRKSWESALASTWPIARAPRDFDPEDTRANFDQNVLAVIRAHPEITWDLWFPPHSLAYQTYFRMTIPAGWDAMFGWKRSILAAVSALPQVRLHDFQGWAPFVESPTHYADIVHFDLPTHTLLLEQILRRTELATPATLLETETLLRREARPEVITSSLKPEASQNQMLPNRAALP